MTREKNRESEDVGPSVLIEQLWDRPTTCPPPSCWPGAAKQAPGQRPKGGALLGQTLEKGQRLPLCTLHQSGGDHDKAKKPKGRLQRGSRFRQTGSGAKGTPPRVWNSGLVFRWLLLEELCTYFEYHPRISLGGLSDVIQ